MVKHYVVIGIGCVAGLAIASTLSIDGLALLGKRSIASKLMTRDLDQNPLPQPGAVYLATRTINLDDPVSFMILPRSPSPMHPQGNTHNRAGRASRGQSGSRSGTGGRGENQTPESAQHPIPNGHQTPARNLHPFNNQFPHPHQSTLQTLPTAGIQRPGANPGPGMYRVLDNSGWGTRGLAEGYAASTAAHGILDARYQTTTNGPSISRFPMPSFDATAIRSHGDIMAMAGATVAPFQPHARTTVAGVGNRAVTTRVVVPPGGAARFTASSVGQPTERRTIHETPHEGITMSSRDTFSGMPIHHRTRFHGAGSAHVVAFNDALPQ